MVQQASRPVVEKGQEYSSCRHHWIIEAPMGPVSRGMCRLCEEVREFKNYMEAAPWGEDAPVAQSNGQYSVVASADDVDEPE